MKKALRKDTLIEIKKTFKRFLSILVMALLGVGFFAGLRATPSDMSMTLDKYADDTNLFDIQVISTLGLTDDDVNRIKELEYVEEVYPVYDEDTFVKINDEENERIIKVLELTDEINKVKLQEGNLPKDNTECLIDSFMAGSGVKVGDYLTIKEDIDDSETDLEDEDKEEPTYKCSKVKVVGIVTSPLYMSIERGTTTLGNGKIEFFVYVPKSNIDSDVYSSIYVKVENTNELDGLSKEYQEKVDCVISELEEIKEDREDFRYKELITEANEKLDDAEKELNEEKEKAEKEIADAEKKIKDGKKEISDAKKEISDGERELADGRNKLNTEMTDAENKINKSYEELTLGEIELNKKETELEDGIKIIEEKKDELKLNLDQVIQGLESIDFYIKSLEHQITLSTNEGEKQELNKNLVKFNEEKIVLEQTQQQILAGIKQIDENIAQVEAGKVEIEKNRQIILNGYAELDKARNTLNEEKVKAENELNKAQIEINDAKKKLADGEKDLNDGEQELIQAKKEFEEEITKAENKLIDARTKVNDIKEAKWYLNDRTDLSGYNEYDNNIDNIDKIAKAFPIVFFVIAVLISLTSMTRMVEEQRVQIGTLKALGYTRLQIAYKYLMYATIATVVGGMIGMCFGFQFFPRVIISLYEIMYVPMEVVVKFNIKYAIIGLGAMLACMCGATMYAANKELSSEPAELMRPKAPKVGKRVFIEKIHFIWKKIGFIQKVTIRNMFRYKKRFCMTVLGITGCTALILAGFGLQDSISYIIPTQYDKVFSYDMMVFLNDDLTNEEIQSFDTKIESIENVKSATEIYQESSTVINGELEREIYLIVSKSPEEFKDYISLYDMDNNKEEIFLKDGEILITDKLSDLIDVEVGDKIKIIDSEDEEREITIGKIVEHYTSHFMYMTEETYKETFDKEKSTNILFLDYEKDLNKDEEKVISEQILESSKAISVILTSDSMSSLDDTLSALNIVVYVLIVAAGLLAFVVLYNLSNVNISERIRELATIKVLGFYDKEVYDYVARETIFLTIIGIILGLLFGIGLTDFILTTCEVDITRFPRHIDVSSMIISAAITGIFTAVVNFITYFSLKKIDMIESLKSIE